MARDYILQANGLPILLRTFSATLKYHHQKNIVWAVRTLCKVKPPPPAHLISTVVPFCVSLLNGGSLVDVDVCSLLSTVWRVHEELIPEELIPTLCKKAVSIILRRGFPQNKPAIKVVGHTVACKSRIDIAISCGALVALNSLLKCRNASIRRETCKVISQITSGAVCHIESVFEAGLIDSIMPLTSDSRAAQVIANVVKYGDSSQIQRIVAKGGISCLCQQLINLTEYEVVLAVLEAIEKLSHGYLINLTDIEKMCLESLTCHIDPSISQTAKSCWKIVTEPFFQQLSNA